MAYNSINQLAAGNRAKQAAEMPWCPARWHFQKNNLWGHSYPRETYTNCRRHECHSGFA